MERSHSQQQDKLYTREEFWEYIALPENRDRKLELIDGVIVEVSPNWKHGKLSTKLAARLLNFTETHDLGDGVVVEVDFYIPDDPNNTRRPDVAFVRKERVSQIDEDSYVPFMPDLAIEVKSVSNTLAELREKAVYYLQHGTRLVWIFRPDDRLVEVYELGKERVVLTELGILDGGDVLPGFRLPLSEIF